MKNLLKRISKTPWAPICFIGIVILFFSIRLVITFDSAHYLNYVAVFEGNMPMSSWDIVRGPVFPTIIFLFENIFGKIGSGILVGTFIFYLVFAISCYKVCKELCKNLKHKNLIQNIILGILILNPMIMGYFHVLLTEFIAITATMLNIIIAYKWLYCDNNKKQLTFYSIYFIFNLIFCYHLKQPYIIIAFIPPFIASIMSVIKNHTAKNVFYRFGTLLCSFVILFASILSWNKILESQGVNMNTGRDSSSMLSQQILRTYQIDYTKNEKITTINALGILLQNFFSNPGKIIGIYINNYCAISSTCIIDSSNGVDYIATSQISIFKAFENTTIGYRPYSSQSNIFNMPDNLYNMASEYGESSDRSLLAYVMNIFRVPTNILFKLSIILCFPFVIILIFVKTKRKDKKYLPLFQLSFILLFTAFAHIAISAGVGLIIDRYAIEAFAPSLLGIIGTIIYIDRTKPNLPKKIKRAKKYE